MLRAGVFAVIAGVAVSSCTSRARPDIAADWYPLGPGNTWTYQEETLDGDMDHPDVDRTTWQETVVNSVTVPELAGTLVTLRTKVLSESLTPKHDTESHLLIHQNCVYVLDGPKAMGARCGENGGECSRPNREDLLNGKIAPDFCFPIAVGMTWGKVPNTSPALEFVWKVTGLNADPFGPPGNRTFHMLAHLYSGSFVDRWFTQGVGVVQEVEIHHGTYDESREQLLSATINGKTQSYQLRPAQTAPLTPDECEGPGWRHYARADGSSFTSQGDCSSYADR